MSDKQAQSPGSPSPTGAAPSDAASSRRPLTPEAQRALAEAEARRLAAKEEKKENIHGGAKEIQGPSGLDPTRYGDWENKGIASDF